MRVLRDWLTERAGQPADVLFPARHGKAMSRDTFQARLTKYKTTAAQTCPSLAAKKLAPHVLRHSTAMWGAPKLPDSPSIRMDVWKGEVIASTEEELLSRIQG